MKKNLPILISLSPTILLISITLINIRFPFFNIVQFFLIGVIAASNVFLIFFLRNKNQLVTMKDKKVQENSETINIDSSANSQTTSQEKVKYETVLANIGEGLVVSNKSGQIITFNKAAESMLGWTEKEAIGKNLRDIINVNYKNGASDSYYKNQAKLYFVRKDGKTFPAAITDTSYVGDGKILGTITLFRDISTELNVDSIRSEFIALASHQLRTPLSAIKWYTDMLIKGDVGELTHEQVEFTKGILLSTNKMIDLVGSLLNISRIESGRISIEPKPTDIKSLIDEVLKEVKVKYGQKKQIFELNIPEGLPQISVDPSLVTQIYLNLLTNAAKYTPEAGKISIKIEIKDGNLVSSVSDSGYGIPESEKNRVFDKFYRGTNIVQTVADGTGLGLYLIKAIVEICKGKIWYESQEGKGSTFSFSLSASGTPAKKGVVRLG